MRRVVDITIIVAVGIAALVVFNHRGNREDPALAVARVQGALTALYDRTSYHGALEDSQSTTRTLWPVAVLPQWFVGELPSNTLLPDVAAEAGHLVSGGPSRPWIDVAPPGDKALHPPDPVAVRQDQAQFWYNPAVGVFRARVAATLGEPQALALYNQVNGTELATMPFDTDPRRSPLAYNPTPGMAAPGVTAPGVAHASPQSLSPGRNPSRQTSSLFKPKPATEEEAPAPTRRPTLRDAEKK